MRIILPTRISVGKAFLFTSVLVLAEVVEGTEMAYAGLVFCYFMLSVLAFNTAGGFSRPSGAYIFFYSVLVAGLGTVFKAILGQAADSHLQHPVLVMAVYTATLGAMLIAAALTRRIATTVDGAAGILKIPTINYERSALGCLIFYFLVTNAGYVIQGGLGTAILHAIALINLFLPLTVLLSTIAAVRSSNGQRSATALTLIVVGYSTFQGMLSFSKQAMFTPFVCWVIGIAWARFEMRKVHILSIILFAVIAQEFFTPLAGVGRTEAVYNTPEEHLAIVEHYAMHPLLLKKISDEGAQSSGQGWYYGKPEGIMDRLTMLPNDADLIDFTSRGHYFGYSPIAVYFLNWVPHIINPHKLEGMHGGSGNAYAHELGGLADEDVTTGISYSPSAEAYHLDGWRSVFVLQPFIFLLLFVVSDAVSGDVRVQPWGLLPILVFAHLAPEGLLGGAINFVWLGSVGTIFGMFVCGYITPVLGQLVSKHDQAPAWRMNTAATLSAAGPQTDTA